MEVSSTLIDNRMVGERKELLGARTEVRMIA